MICPHCGTPVEKSTRFCASCGYRFGGYLFHEWLPFLPALSRGGLRRTLTFLLVAGMAILFVLAMVSSFLHAR